MIGSSSLSSVIGSSRRFLIERSSLLSSVIGSSLRFWVLGSFLGFSMKAHPFRELLCLKFVATVLTKKTFVTLFYEFIDDYAGNCFYLF